ncbi:MAG: LysE family translocator [Candidatus Competibacteraceae bacterium]|jgi:threonine/homoserine/homoserine lactone efflux protein|nr:LysE family translocator [Candidatus Competibacteraceae bacterium]
MDFSTWLAFTVAAAIILIIPGPTIVMVVAQSFNQGRRAAVPLVLGVVLGDFTAMVGSLLGLGAVLATSALLFTILKWIGAAYLIYLGIKTWKANVSPEIGAQRETTPYRSLFFGAYVVTALNPKSIMFFIAFLPQFIDPHYAALPQLLFMGVTFLLLAGLNTGLYALFAGNVKHLLRKPAAQRIVNRVGGGALVGAGVATAAISDA